MCKRAHVLPDRKRSGEGSSISGKRRRTFRSPRNRPYLCKTKSEKYVQGYYPELPAQAFIHYGNFIGDTIKIAADLEIKAVTLGIMIGKAVKLAEGNLDTHSKQVTMNKDFLREVALSAGCGGETLAVIEKITLARELWTLLSAEDLQAFCSRLLELCHQYCDPLLPEGELTILLISEEGKIIT